VAGNTLKGWRYTRHSVRTGWKAKPLGRPSALAVENHVSPGERNPVEGKFGQSKLGYGLDCIKAKLQETSRGLRVLP